MLKFLNSLGGKVSEGINIPISAEIVEKIIINSNVKDVEPIEVSFDNEFMKVSGKVKKIGLQMPFEIIMRPSEAKGRMLSFSIEQMLPINNSWINNKLFNRPPYLTFLNDIISIDLQANDTVKKVPIGSIKHFQIKDSMLWINIGI